MNLTYLTVEIANPANHKKLARKRPLVDSGAIYSVVEGETLQELGIKPHSKRKFILANGEEIEKELGDAFFIFQEQKASSPVVFGDKDIFLLGVTTLESLGLILNPIDRKLRPLPMVI